MSRSHRIRFAMFSATTLVGVAIFVGIGSGALRISPSEIVSILLAEAGVSTDLAFSSQQRAVLLHIRVPRVILGVFVGAGLAMAGAALQGLFRNPLADPGLVGVSSGAALAASSCIVLGPSIAAFVPDALELWVLPVSAFVGSLITTALVWRLGSMNGSTNVATMLLAGIALNAIAMAGTGLLTVVATDAELRTLSFWTLGSLNGGTWEALSVLCPSIGLVLVVIPMFSRQLNALLLGEAQAFHLGVDTELLKRVVIVMAALAVGVSVAFTGMIGFVGLVAPHLVRLAIGADHRCLLPLSALLGASLLTLADVLARTMIVPAEIPIGIVTALLGAPFFLVLITREVRKGVMGR